MTPPPIGEQREPYSRPGAFKHGTSFPHTLTGGTCPPSQRSPSVPQGDVIANEVSELLASASFTDADGITRRLTETNALIVAAYNQQVRCLRERLPAALRVGTVDKFQGQEAPVVFFSMACSSADEIP